MTMQYFKTTYITNDDNAQRFMLEHIALEPHEVIEVLVEHVRAKEKAQSPKPKKTYTKKVKVAKVGAYKKKGSCDECGSPSRHKATCSKSTKGAKKITPTPEKIGERAIDQKPTMLTADEWDDIKDAHNDGMAIDAIAFTLKLDTDQVRLASKCENYTQYTARY